MKTAIIAVMAMLYGATTLTALSVPVPIEKSIPNPKQLLARITVYWAKGPGTDKWSKNFKSSTGIKLKPGHCAVDPKRIPYFANLKMYGS